MKIGIIDADLIGREKHRFPNLACEKISGYWKEQGAEVHLLLDYLFPTDYDYIYISKVFTDTETCPIPEDDKRIRIGGTGFYFDKAPNLPDEIEHHMAVSSLAMMGTSVKTTLTRNSSATNVVPNAPIISPIT